MKDMYNKYYLKGREERLDILLQDKKLQSIDVPVLNLDKANSMVENYLFNYQIPLGLGLNFKINGKEYIIPMAIEEPSVIAAASNGAKNLGDIQASMETKAVIGQIVLIGVANMDLAKNLVLEHKEELLEQVKSMTQSMMQRGGGPRKIWTESFVDKDVNYFTVYISIDTCDAMGANTINTILEGISDKLEVLLNAKSLLRIISNNSTESIVKAKAEVSLDKLNKDKSQAIDIARKIEMATNYANLDPYRAATHNKGIMNGIDAVVLATGNDWRAVEASCHAYAARDGKYKSLTNWKYDEINEILVGEIELPIPVASLGGTISVHPIAKWSLSLLGNPSAKELAMIIASVGLCQNFSAVKAIVTEGIQKGHMSLHARSVAMQAGAEEDEVDQLVKILKKQKKINVDEANKILNDMRNNIL